MMNRKSTSIALSLAAGLCIAAAAYAASAPAGQASTGAASGPATGTAGTPGAVGTSGPGSAGAAAPATAPAAPTNAQGAAPQAQPASAMGKYADDEIVNMVLTVDGNEISMGAAAEKKKMGKDAMKFAKEMVKDHRSDSTKVAKLAAKLKLTPATTSRTDELRAKGMASMQALSAKDSLEFEQAYISAMVQDHTDALALLDDHLIKDVSDAKLKKQLESTRKSVSEHLEHAKRLQGARASR